MFLKKIASLFDPLGFLAPYVVHAKMLLQQIWTSGIDWDDTLRDQENVKAVKWFEELDRLASVRVPRCIQFSGKATRFSLHVFADASEMAYGAVTYARCEYEDGGISVRIVGSKSRVAPLVATSMPRLELLGAQIALKLGKVISSSYKVDMKQVTFWLDSMDVLWWIQNQSRRFKPFVANRVGEIHDQTNPSQWRYVPTKHNLTDHMTRGLTVDGLCNEIRWWKGPELLKGNETEWPEKELKKQEPTKELRKRQELYAESESQTLLTLQKDASWRLDPKRFSNWTKLKRLLAWIYRFISNCSLPKEKRVTGELLPEEITEAEVQLIKHDQREHFPEEYRAVASLKPLPNTSKILNLKPCLDYDGLLRCNGRLQYYYYYYHYYQFI